MNNLELPDDSISLAEVVPKELSFRDMMQRNDYDSNRHDLELGFEVICENEGSKTSHSSKLVVQCCKRDQSTSPTAMSNETSSGVEDRWKEESFQEMAQLWNLSLQDQQKMRQLQERIADINHWKNDPLEVIRYYKEYKGNLKQTEKMFRHMIQWRRDQGMDSFLEDYGAPDPLFHQMPIAILDTTDKDGDPIYVDRMGVADSWNLLKHFGTNAMVDYIVFIRELSNDRNFWKPYEDKVGHRVKNFTVVIDLEGLSSGHMRPGLLPLLQRTARVSQDYYAGWGKRIILIRAPSIFKFIWSVARHFFDQHIQDLIVFGNHSDYLEVLEEYIELENLPPCIAPKQGKAGAMPGYFEKVSLQGGPLDKNLASSRKPATMEKESSLTSVTSTATSSSSSSSSLESPVSVKTVLTGEWDETGYVVSWPWAEVDCIL